MNKNEKIKTGNKDREQENLDSRLEQSETSASNAPKDHEEILRDQISEGLKIYDHSSVSILISSFTAGLEIGFSFLLLCTLFHFFDGKLPEETIFKLLSFAYPVGFILVILGKSILFTEQTSLLTLPVLNKKRSWGALFKVWGMVIAGNLTGGYAIAAVLVWIGPHLKIFSLDAPVAIALHVIRFDPFVILVSAILAGWLMALLSWLLTSSKDTVSRFFLIYLITGMLSFAGLHHSIVGNIDAFAGFLISPGITFGDYLTFMAAALAGNSIGGVFFVAMLKYRAFEYDVKG